MPRVRAVEGAIARALWRLRLGGAIAWSVPLYWLVVFPQARRELNSWERRARRIPDPALRAHALRKLQSEAMTAEGASAFAILATARSCRNVVRACVAFEVIYDYIDALGEEPSDHVLETNRLLYGALGAAFASEAPVTGWSASRCGRDDGGYLRALVETCRNALALLPACERVRPMLLRLAARAGEAQSLHHACGTDGEEALACWAAAQQPPGAALDWWELAAASGSPLGFFALLAAAAHRRTGLAEAAAIEQAYFPWIAALSWLLESAVDQAADLVDGNHSYVGHYCSAATTAQRLAMIAAHANTDARCLPQAARHTLLLAGMVGMYLSDAGSEQEGACETAAAVRDAIGGPLVLLLWTLRVRRRFAR